MRSGPLVEKVLQYVPASPIETVACRHHNPRVARWPSILLARHPGHPFQKRDQGLRAVYRAHCALSVSCFVRAAQTRRVHRQCMRRTAPGREVPLNSIPEGIPCGAFLTSYLPWPENVSPRDDSARSSALSSALISRDRCALVMAYPGIRPRPTGALITAVAAHVPPTL